VVERRNLSDMHLAFRWRRSLTFQIGQSKQRLVISSNVLRHFRNHQQRRSGSLEAGGQLFARLALDAVVVELATGPRETDFRTVTQYVPNRSAEQAEIDHWHGKGLHYVGDWHTHPESFPQPSQGDSVSIRETFVKSKHSLLGFLLIVVGTEKFPKGLHVSLIDALDTVLLGCIPS
jgi:integrative and conjugative element protein (TIGR02256 family)